jgi:8-oxo-dGTP diphosphatase
MNSSNSSDDKRPKVGVAILIEKDGKVLLGKRKGAHGAGTWAPPGGHIEFGETFEETAKREALEEIGVRIIDPVVVGITNDFFEKEQKHYITVFIAAETKDTPKIMEPEKCSNLSWFNWKKLPTPLFLPMENFLDQSDLTSEDEDDEEE